MSEPLRTTALPVDAGDNKKGKGIAMRVYYVLRRGCAGPACPNRRRNIVGAELRPLPQHPLARFLQRRAMGRGHAAHARARKPDGRGTQGYSCVLEVSALIGGRLTQKLFATRPAPRAGRSIRAGRDDPAVPPTRSAWRGCRADVSPSRLHGSIPACGR